MRHQWKMFPWSLFLGGRGELHIQHRGLPLWDMVVDRCGTAGLCVILSHFYPALRFAFIFLISLTQGFLDGMILKYALFHCLLFILGILCASFVGSFPFCLSLEQISFLTGTRCTAPSSLARAIRQWTRARTTLPRFCSSFDFDFDKPSTLYIF